VRVKRKFIQFVGKHWIELLLYGMLVIFVVWRLLYITADAAGTFQNSDEPHHMTDARKIVLYGTVFYDAYVPTVLMPVFTLYEVPFVKSFGVGFFGFRIGSIVAVMGSAWLMCRLLRKRGEWLAGLLLMLWFGVGFLFFVSSRLGNQDPVLMLFSTMTAYWLYQSLETNRVSHYVATFLLALTVPFIKTSGVFIYGMIGGCLLYKALTDRKSVVWSKVLFGVVSSGVVLLLAYLFWFRPNWNYLVFLFDKEVVAKRAPSVLVSAKHLVSTTFAFAPFVAALSVASVLRFVDGFLRKPRQCDNLDVILFCWLVSACAPLAYSSLWFPRWMLWFMMPLGVLGIREFTRIVDGQRAAVRRTLVAVFIVGTIARSWPFYSEYYRTMTFYVPKLISFVEQMAGTNVISGAGLSELDYSPTLNILWDYEFEDQTCEEIQKAYPTPDKTPQFIGVNVNNDPSKFQENLRAWYATCPEWKTQYQPFMVSQRIDYNGICDIWMIRTNVQLSGNFPVIGPKTIR
jgi:4-amino-4-deoxy-L-arabinose transferase-like glycosyltransferase